MTLAEERELEVVKGGLTYIISDDHSENPHWHAKYTWLEDPVSLPNNRGLRLRSSEQNGILPRTPNGKLLMLPRCTTWSP